MKKLLLIIIFLGYFSGIGQECGLETVSSEKIAHNGVNNIVISGVYINTSGGTNNHGIDLRNCNNVVIENSIIESPNGRGVYLYNCKDVTIKNCFFVNNSTGVSVEFSSGIKVIENQFKNPQGPFPRGQYVQFNNVTGVGNKINYNVGESFVGENVAEDLISIYKTHGTPSSPVEVIGNKFRGSGDSASGGGIMTGDKGGSYILVKDNILVDPGQYGIGIAGGTNISIINNKVYAKQQSFTNVGVYVANYSSSYSGNHTVRGNEVNWTNKEGNPNHFWKSSKVGPVTGWDENIKGAKIDETILPEKIVCVDFD